MSTDSVVITIGAIFSVSCLVTAGVITQMQAADERRARELQCHYIGAHLSSLEPEVREVVDEWIAEHCQ